MLGSLRAAVGAARRHESLYFAALLSEERILEAFGSARFLWQGWVYTPAVTVWVFLSQCLSPDHSCRDAVARFIAARAMESEKCPWQVSFKGALQTLSAFLPILSSGVSSETWCDALVAAIATHTVGDRPDRYEPRVRKRRPKEYDLMNKPRADYKRQMAK